MLKDTGRTLISYAIESALAAKVTTVIVASDSDEILEEAATLGATPHKLQKEHTNGTSRVLEASESLDSEHDVIINFQAKEPQMRPEDLTRLSEGLRFRQSWQWVTFSAPLTEDERHMRSVVKVAVSTIGDALYFSRAPLAGALKHVGVYAFKRLIMPKLKDIPDSYLAMKENLEQLTWVDFGWKGGVV